MSIGSNTPPYPKRCGTVGCVFGSSAYQHVIADVIRAKYKNTTQYAVDGVTAAPVPLWYHEDECSVPQSAPYVDQLGTILAAVMPGYQNTGNSFTADGNVTIQTACQKLIGFKNVQAQKWWHGTYGIDYSTSGKDCATDTTYSDTKYRTIVCDVTFRYYDQDGTRYLDPVNNPASPDYNPAAPANPMNGALLNYLQVKLAQTITVARNSGILTISGTADEGTYYNYNSDGTFDSSYADSSYDYVKGWITGMMTGCGVPSWYASAVADTSSVFPNTPTCSRTQTNTAHDISVESKYTTSGGYVGIFSSFIGTVDLSDSYTVANVKSDAEQLADEIDMDDDIIYPYRTDANAFIAPLVIRNEVPTPVSPVGFRATGWTDPNATTRNAISGLVYSSDIIGALLPAGYGQGSPRGVFDINHKNLYRSICGTPPVEAIGPRTIGKWTPSYLPANCALWTQDERFANIITANKMWPVQFILADNDGVYLQKWKETLIIPPNGSFNAARPYGADRFVIDETQFYCYDGGTLYDNAASPASQPDLVLTGLWGGECVDGFYNGATTDGSGVLTLGPKILDLPTGWSVPSEDTETVFAKLRWENTTKRIPGFGGKLDVAAAYDSGANETTFIYASSPYIVDGDKVSVMGFGDSIIATNLTLTRLGDTSCKVTGDYSTALWLVPYKLWNTTTDGTKYYFANDTSKGVFVARTWTLEMAGWTQTDATVEQTCLEFNNCRPQTLVASPNGETVAASYEMEWPTTLDPNTVWIGEFMQWMVDPFWQTPHDPCGGGPLPDQTCVTPYVEARIAVGTNYGLAQNETGPTPISPINLGATLSPPAVADPTGTGALPELLTNPTKPWTVQVSCYE